MSPVDPTLELERELLAAGARIVVGVDEVGRGAIAGPVAVGVAVVDGGVDGIPEGLRDSKLLSEPRREALAPAARAWALGHGVGEAAPAEVERLGIVAALGLAAVRALDAVRDAGVPLGDSVLLLDGTHDWLTPAMVRAGRPPLRVVTRVKADRDCAVVAAASVIAKVHRDAIMIAADAEAPDYAWASNKGYASAAHYAAIERVGPHPLHRISWLRTTLPVAVDGAADTPADA